MPRDNLGRFSRHLNEKTLLRLRGVMIRYNLRRSHVADLLGISRVLVTRWFKHERRCPDGVPDRLRMIMLRSRDSIEDELKTKREARTKHRKTTPSYPKV